MILYFSGCNPGQTGKFATRHLLPQERGRKRTRILAITVTIIRYCLSVSTTKEEWVFPVFSGTRQAANFYHSTLSSPQWELGPNRICVVLSSSQGDIRDHTPQSLLRLPLGN